MTVTERLLAEIGAVDGVWHLQGGWGYKAHVCFDETFVRGRFRRAAGTLLCSGKAERDMSPLMIERDKATLAGPDGTFTLDLCLACRRKAEHLRNPVKRKPRIRRHRWATQHVRRTFCLACGLDVKRSFNFFELRTNWYCTLAGRNWTRVPTCEAVWPPGWMPAHAPTGFMTPNGDVKRPATTLTEEPA
jgi:hypothetical protein